MGSLLRSKESFMAKRSSGNDSDQFWGIEGRLSCFLAFLLLLTSDGVVVGARTKPVRDMELQRRLKRLNKPAVKTIQLEDGDIVDCVDIHKQPAFDHPLLKNHTIQMKPSFYPKGNEGNSSSMELLVQQFWGKSGSCPEGTIPIQRIQNSHLLMGNSSSLGSYAINYAPGTGRVEAAGAHVSGGPYYGVKSKLSVWKVSVESNEWSLNSVMIGNSNNHVEFGWGVNPIIYGDDKSRLYATWKRYDGDKITGCYNLLCPGFVQVSKKIMLGFTVSPLSTYKGAQYYIEPMISADSWQPNWWILFGNEPVGYWPMSLFNYFYSADRALWAGGVLNTETWGEHTTTQLGSGHFADEGLQMAAFFSNLLLIDSKNNVYPSWGHNIFSSFRGCYNAVAADKFKEDQGALFFYGGPGGPGCDAGKLNE